MEALLVLVILFICCTLIFAVIGLLLLRMRKLRNIELRLKTYISESIDDNQTNPNKLKTLKIPSIIASLGSALRGLPINRKLKKLLEEAGLPLKAEDFFVIRIVTAAFFFLIIFLLGYHFIFCILGLILGYWIPRYYVKYRRQRRLTLCVNQLAETLGIMANSLRAGYSFMQAMQLIGKEMSDPIGPEFERAVQDVSYGVPLEKSFENMVNRLPDKNLDMVLSALLIQRKSGGNLAELLETMQETVRGRIRIKEEIRTLTAEGRISGIIITLLPIALGIYFYLVNPDYFTILLEEPLGWVLLGFGSIFMFIGWLIVRKIVRIEV